MNTLNVVVALPDDGNVEVTDIKAGDMKFAIPGTANFIEHLPPTRTWNYVWVGRLAPAQSRMLLCPVVNYIAEADRCKGALTAAVNIANTVGQRWFNHPAHVLETTRDRNSQVLQGIAGLDVPRTIRVTPRNPADIFGAIASKGLSYPVLVRTAGVHGGRDMVRIDGPDVYDDLFSLPWGGREIYVTEFRDFADEDGLYRKVRLGVLNGHPYIRHAVVSETWNVAPATRSTNPRFLEMEASTMERFKATLLPAVLPIVGEIYRRLRLDYFGIDCAIRSDGSMILFEANATMTLLRRRPPPNMWDATITEMHGALQALLDDPGCWIAA